MEDKSRTKLQSLLEQIYETCQTIQNHEDPMKITPDLRGDIEKFADVVKKLKVESQKLSELNEKGEKLCHLLKIDDNQSQQEASISNEREFGDHSFILRAKEIETEASVMKLALVKGKEAKRKSGANAQKSDERRKMKERKKLFKTIGGDQKWIPL